MKIDRIPDMPELEFEEDSHIYRLNGLVVPSVTTVLSPLSAVKYKGISKKVLENAADKGTEVHNAIDNYIKFGIEDISSENAPYFEAFKKWWHDNSPVVVGSENRLYHKILRYAGTVDLVCYINDELTLVDYKTTYSIIDMICGVQLEAYAKAAASHNISIQKKKILQLKKDAEYDDSHEFPANDLERWRVFTCLKNVHDYVQAYK